VLCLKRFVLFMGLACGDAKRSSFLLASIFLDDLPRIDTSPVKILENTDLILV
jgi:hypothetical protein